MRRFMIGAVALVTGLLAAGGVALTTRRRRNRDEVLQLDAAPPLSSVDTTKGYDPSYADPRGRRWTVGLRASWT